MGVRTYLPKLLAILRYTCKYIRRWESQIEDALQNDSQRNALHAVVTACEAMEAILEVVIPPQS